MIGVVIDDEAYHDLTSLLIDYMFDQTVSIFAKQPTTVLVLIQSCLQYHSEKRQEYCNTVLYECYCSGNQEFNYNIVMIFNEKYPQVPNGLKQSFIQNKSFNRREFKELFNDFFKIFKQ